MNRFAAFCLLLVSLSAIASPFNPVRALAKQTGLTVNEINAIVTRCDASQANTNICARYEQIKAEHRFQEAVVAKRSACASDSAISKQSIALWESQRDRTCKATAQRQWDGGSMEPTAESMCIAEVTKKKITSIRDTNCRQRSSHAATVGSALLPKSVWGNAESVGGN